MVNLTTHISGLASGLDTEKLISDMMKVNKIPLDKLQQSKTLNSWKTDAYREINTKIASFRDAMQDLRLQGTFNAQKVTSGDARIDTSMAGVSTQMNFSISEAKLATPAKGGSVSFDTKIGKGSDKIDPSATTDLTFKLNGIDFTIPKDSTFDQAISQINSNSDKTNVKVYNVGGSLVFNTSEVGSGKSITITNVSANAQSLLKIVEGDTNTGTGFTAGTYSDGSPAEQGHAVINGTKINISANTFTYDGVQINLKQAISEGSPAAVSIAADTDKIFDKLKTFVDKYNELVKDLNDKLSESKNRNYPPLTDAQKKDMKDADIKLWEDKAKSGLLANDPTIRQFLTQLRTSMSETIQTAGINTSFDSLQKIGIKTSTDYRDNGKLTLDESKLKSLLAGNLTDIQNMFSKKFDTGVATDTTVTSSTKYKNSGFAIRVYDKIAETLSQLKVKAGAPGTISINSDLAKEATSLDDRISKSQVRINAQEQALWTKFNAMEKALQKLNSQSTFWSQQLGQ
ncbi:flagellar filament capping protein FliD [Neobacillus drentensis]|uniref:flagellar filament capping protein FliD n=1 Tax=Neobacillus drentensis TaxID=220684 RepID=UPI0028650669|nr:flagellar filament capping protein FliD [Neobacillus drentensis]MDR7235690.1 flagellar hook-associated protein 2 [Neobacillus drentensis]